ncbi:MAG: transposase [Methanoregula sp.]|nr:transposase [Methanoregula sp.]
MHKSYQYRLYPTKAQTTFLNRTFDLCRKVYNNTLALRRDSWDYDQKSLTCFDTANELVLWKQDHPELKMVHSQVLQNAQMRVDLAFKAFFRRVKAGENPGYPRFKSFGRYDSITYPQSGFEIKKGLIKFSKIGEIKTIFHRPMEGKIKTVTIRRTPTQKWFVSISCDDVPTHPLPESGKCVGIDVGLKTFAMLSNGKSVDNPRFYQNEQENLATAQRKLSLCEKGSIARKRAWKVVARVHERISNKREDFIQKLSHSLVNRYGVICFEDLNIKDMAEDPRFAKGIMDAAWSKLVQYTSYKAEDAGRRVVLVDPKNTSQMCSRCGQIVAKDIPVRIHDCQHCGYKADRDLNAAINILRLGIQSLSERRTRSLVL